MKNTNQNQLKYSEALEKAGFTDKETFVYELILRSGQLGVGEIITALPYKRGDLYNILYSLRDKGAIEQTIKGGKINFKPKDPYHLIEYLDKQKESIIQASSFIEAALPQMFSEYNLNMGKPSIHYFEGNTGIEKVYELINSSGEKEFLLFRSIFDNDDLEEKKIIDRQKKKQIELGIRMRFLAPLTEKTKDHYYFTDKKKLVERRIIQKTRFSLPAQIMVWGDNVAIVSLKKSKIITVIQNKDVAETFRVIFEYIWEAAEDFHQTIIERWVKEDKNN